jgi:hypothetical protein
MKKVMSSAGMSAMMRMPPICGAVFHALKASTAEAGTSGEALIVSIACPPASIESIVVWPREAVR